MFSFTHRISIETEKIVNNKCLSLDVIKKNLYSDHITSQKSITRLKTDRNLNKKVYFSQSNK
jgi:hypothetical protein